MRKISGNGMLKSNTLHQSVIWYVSVVCKGKLTVLIKNGLIFWLIYRQKQTINYFMCRGKDSNIFVKRKKIESIPFQSAGTDKIKRRNIKEKIQKNYLLQQ